MNAAGVAPTARKVTVRARAFVAAAGAIGTPALLLRSGTPDPHGLVGKRTFLHPSLVSAAVMPERVDGFAGAPQSVLFRSLSRDAADRWPVGLQARGAAAATRSSLPRRCPTTACGMRNGWANFRNLQVLIALLRDGFNPESEGGAVRLGDDGTPVLDYPLGRVVWEGARRAFLSMAEIQFARGRHARVSAARQR